MRFRTAVTRSHPEIRMIRTTVNDLSGNMPLKKKFKTHRTVARNGKYSTRTGQSTPSRAYFHKSYGGYPIQY